MNLVDTHCHLQFDRYTNPAGVIQEAIESGVTKFICVGTNLADSRRAIEFAKTYDSVWAAVGVHPHDADDFVEPRSVVELEKLQVKPRVVAVGEIGLDYYKNLSGKDGQQKVLRAQIEIGLKSGLPFIFHVRDAWEDFWAVLDSYPKVHGVVHSFSAHPAQLDQILSRGLWVGLNGIMTFTKDDQQLEAAKLVPLDKLMLETDAPFLTPAPFRGKVCEPKHLKITAEFLANLRGESLEELTATTTKNAQQLFNIN